MNVGINNSATKTTVAHIRKLHADMQQKLAEQLVPPLQYAELPDVDGVNITSIELYDFACELRSQMRGIKFGPAFGHYVTRNYDVLSVYYEEDEFILGQIAYGPDNSGVNKYIVQSRLISNERYSRHNHAYHTRAGNDMKRMLREAKKNLRRWNPTEVAALSRSEAGDRMRQYLRKFERAESDAREKLVGSIYVSKDRPIFKEFRHMLNTGYEFADPTFRDLIAEWVDAEKILSEHDLQFPVKFVNIAQRFGRQVVHTVDTEYRNGDVYMSFKDGSAPIVQSFQSDDVPEDVVEKVSVLSILGNDEYVEGVGYKHNETTYWLHV